MTKIEWTHRPGTKGESWNPIPQYPDYDASNLGRIRSRRRGKPQVLSLIVKPDGYSYVFLYHASGESDKVYVHHAVLWAFVGPCPLSMECRHLDGNQGNNAIDNLQWGTRLENWADRRRNGKVPPIHLSPLAKLAPQDIPQIRALAQQGLSSRRIAPRFGVSHTTILEILRGNRWEAY